MFDINDPTVELATGLTSTVNGSFDLAIGSSKAFEGGVVKVIVTGGTGATMVCDVADGCGSTAFGDSFLIDDDFVLSALIEAPADEGILTVNVSAITTLAAALAEANADGGKPDAEDIAAANQEVATLFGLIETDLTHLPGLDVAHERIGVEPTIDELRAAFINAGVLGAMLEGNGTIGQRLDRLVTDFAENDGKLILNEAADDFNIISVEDIIAAAIDTADESPLGRDNRYKAEGGLELDLLAIAKSTPGARAGQLPERPILTASVSELSFSSITGGLVTGIPIELVGEGITWNIGTASSWLNVDQRFGVGDATILVYPESLRAPVGINHGTLLIENTMSRDVITVDVEYTVGDVLGLSPNTTITLQSIFADTDTIDQKINVTGENVSWEAASDQAWASLTPTTGISPSQLTVTVDPAGLSVGSHTANITVSDKDFNQKRTTKVKILIEPRLINVAETGVSFSSFPSTAILSREIDVSENLGKPVDWSATSNAGWLTVSSSGKTGDALMLQANSTGLAANDLYSAQVTISSDDNTIENVEQINVSLWVGDTDPDARTEFVIPAENIVADPVKPYLYVNRGSYTETDTTVYPYVTTPVDPDIEIINVYTGESVGRIENSTPQSGVMAVDPDGQTLYVYDAVNFKIVPVDLSTFTARPGWDSVSSMDSMVVKRINGKEILFTGSGQAYDTETGIELVSSYGTYYYSTNNSVAVSKNGKVMCTMNRGLSPYSLYCYDMSYSYVDDQLSLNYHGNVAHGSGSNGRDLALSDDGTKVYAASGSPYNFNVFNTTTMALVQTLAAEAYPNAAEVGPHGIFYGGIDGYGTPADVWAYDQGGNQIANYSFGSLRPRQLVVSGDGSRLMGAIGVDPLRVVFLSTE